MSIFPLSENAIAMADEITIGDLLRITDQEQNRKGILRLISYSKGHLQVKPEKSVLEKNLLLDLIELMNEIGAGTFDEAFSKERARQERQRQRRGVQLPKMRGY